MATSVDEIDVVVKKKKCSSASSTITMTGDSIHVLGADGPDDLRYLRQIGDLVNAAVTGTLQGVQVTTTASGSPNLTVMKRAVSQSGVKA